MNTIAFFNLSTNVESTMVEYTLTDIIGDNNLDVDATYALIREFCAKHNVYWWQQQYKSTPLKRLLCGQADALGHDAVFIETWGLVD